MKGALIVGGLMLGVAASCFGLGFAWANLTHVIRTATYTKGEIIKPVRVLSASFTPEPYQCVIYCAIVDNWPIFYYAKKDDKGSWRDAKTGDYLDLQAECLVEDPFGAY